MTDSNIFKVIEDLFFWLGVDMEVCPKCKGSGKRFFIFVCGHCKGFGRTPKEKN